MAMPRGKKAKKVIRCLSRWQREDDFLSPSTIQLIRYNLLYSNGRCTHVTISMSERLDGSHCTIPYTNLSKFLRSQLEAQKIADGSRLWTQIAPFIAFIHSLLRPEAARRGYPTLFIWRCRETHRSYLFFAFLSLKMASVTYTASQLLGMKALPTKKEIFLRLQAKVQKDVALGEIIRIPLDRSLPLIEEEPVDGYAEYNRLAESAPVQQLDGAGCEWKYRGRDESECGETQPISAPPGLAAQKDEGFQRFYKAVVSPTHVRVTAGGRIVPNTRVPSSPTAKWTKDKGSLDASSTTSQNHRDYGDGAPPPFPAINFGAVHPLMHGFFSSGIHPGIHGPPQFALSPWHMGLGGVNMPTPFPAVGATGPNTHACAVAKHMVPESEKGDASLGISGSENANPVRISPPGQFDHSRPFFYNGQWIMPPTAHYYGYSMPQLQGFPTHSMMNPAVLPVRPSEIPVAHPKATKSEKSEKAANMTTSTASHSAPSIRTKSQPPISSIRPSEITKKQIDVLRGSLRYLEDQLQYNKHQIDEKWMDQQAQMVRQQIQQFEKNLDTQLRFEDSHYPPKKYAEGSSASSNGVDKSTSSISADTSSDASCGRSKAQTVKEQPRHRSSKSFSVSRSIGTSIPTSHMPCTTTPVSTLPVHAALAPPFHPRSDGATPAAVYNSKQTAELPSGTTSPYSSVRGSSSKSEQKPKQPYLVGRLPSGITDDQSHDTDYIYVRDLTEDELRARHMYWGKAPSHLQRGLPKFDGKDFYPPSPERIRSTEASRGQSSAPSSVQQSVFDPFRSLGRGPRKVVRVGPGQSTQSESLLRAEEHDASDATDSPLMRTESCQTNLGHSYIDFRNALYASSTVVSETSLGRASSDDGDDDRSLLFKGRKTMNRAATKSRNEIWQNMLRKGKSSANAVPGTVSSTTVQGVLPNYAGHATAYLTPTLANTTVSPRPSPKTGETTDMMTFAPEKEENMPPVEPMNNKPATAANFA